MHRNLTNTFQVAKRRTKPYDFEENYHINIVCLPTETRQRQTNKHPSSFHMSSDFTLVLMGQGIYTNFINKNVNWQLFYRTGLFKKF